MVELKGLQAKDLTGKREATTISGHLAIFACFNNFQLLQFLIWFVVDVQIVESCLRYGRLVTATVQVMFTAALVRP